MPDTPPEGDGFGSFDPETLVMDPEAAGIEIPPEPEESDEPSFDLAYAEPFKGLLYVGALTKEFEWLGHKFVIRTLTTNELLIVPLVIKDWEGTIGHPRAYASAMVALATITVDGEQLPTPVMTQEVGHAWAIQRFNYVVARWFPYTIDRVYSEYLALDKAASEVVEKMGEASG